MHLYLIYLLILMMLVHHSNLVQSDMEVFTTMTSEVMTYDTPSFIGTSTPQYSTSYTKQSEDRFVTEYVAPKKLNESCHFNIQCSNMDPDSICNEICECKSGYKPRLINTSMICTPTLLPPRSLNESCTWDSQCQSINPNSVCNGVCECITTIHMTYVVKDGTVKTLCSATSPDYIPPIKLNDHCKTSEECRLLVDRNSECSWSNYCICGAKTFPSNGKCVTSRHTISKEVEQGKADNDGRGKEYVDGEPTVNKSSGIIIIVILSVVFIIIGFLFGFFQNCIGGNASVEYSSPHVEERNVEARVQTGNLTSIIVEQRIPNANIENRSIYFDGIFQEPRERRRILPSSPPESDILREMYSLPAGQEQTQNAIRETSLDTPPSYKEAIHEAQIHPPSYRELRQQSADRYGARHVLPSCQRFEEANH